MTRMTSAPARLPDSKSTGSATPVAPKKSRTSKAAKAKKRQRGLYYPLDMTPEEFFTELGKIKRDTADQIERLIALLDRIEGDPDLEPEPDLEAAGDDEPSFGWTAREAQRGCRPTDAMEDEAEPNEDSEPSLGSLCAHECSDQTSWALNRADDREGDLSDNEPSLGWGPDGETGGGDKDLEADLGSFDRIVNQEHALRTCGERNFIHDAEVAAVDLTKIDAARERRNAERQARRGSGDGQLVTVTRKGRASIVNVVPL